MTIRPLTVADTQLIRNLIESRQAFIGVQPSMLTAHQELSLLSLSDLLACGPETGTVFGAFEDGNESLLLGMVETCLSDAQPCYFIRKAHTKPFAPRRTLSNLLTAVIEHYEMKGFGRFYTIYNKADIATYHRLWSTLSVLRNYVTYTDLEVPGNTRPKHSDVWELLCGRTLTPDVRAVRGFIRKSDTMFYNDPV